MIKVTVVLLTYRFRLHDIDGRSHEQGDLDCGQNARATHAYHSYHIPSDPNRDIPNTASNPEHHSGDTAKTERTSIDSLSDNRVTHAYSQKTSTFIKYQFVEVVFFPT